MAEDRPGAVIETIRGRIRQNQFRLSKHVTKRMDLRGWTVADIREVVLAGEIIREYPDEKPYPEYLFLGYPGAANAPCYVVVASNDETVVVTVHDYDPEIYEPDYRTRRKQQ